MQKYRGMCVYRWCVWVFVSGCDFKRGMGLHQECWTKNGERNCRRCVEQQKRGTTWRLQDCWRCVDLQVGLKDWWRVKSAEGTAEGLWNYSWSVGLQWGIMVSMLGNIGVGPQIMQLGTFIQPSLKQKT